MKVGLMQRPERIVLLGLATALSPGGRDAFGHERRNTPISSLVVGCVVLFTVLTQGTAAYRLWYIMRMLDRRSAHGVPPAMSRPAVVGNVVITVGDFLHGPHGRRAVRLARLAGDRRFRQIFSLAYFAWLKLRRAPEAAVAAPRTYHHRRQRRDEHLRRRRTSSLIPAFDYRIAWAMTRAAVGWGWNRPMLPAAANADLPASNDAEV